MYGNKMQSRTERIAKNTFLLYFRQILTMLVSLYTTRVILNSLGAENYGIYHVVFGFVMVFTFLNTAMGGATLRFLNYSIGQNDKEQEKKVFSACFIIHVMIAIFFIILAQTIGLWFFRNWLNIPLDRQSAAFIVFQFWVVIAAINILRSPYDATIIAHEKMSFFAIVSVLEAVMLLCIAILLPLIPYDKLIVYVALFFVYGLINFWIYKIYCNRTFETARFRLCKDRALYRQLAAFSGWSIFGVIGNLSIANGLNILVNIFYGVAVNAALGLATQIENAVYSFVVNFQTAFQPQIVKSYAAKDRDYFTQLIFQTSKVSFYIMFFIALPLFINADFVLRLWLTNVPEHTVIFTRLILLFLLLETFAGPLWMSIAATGNIKKYLVMESSIKIACLPLAFLFLRLGFNPAWVLIIKIGINFLLFAWRILFVSKRIGLSIKKYILDVIMPVIIVVAFSSAVTVFTAGFFVNWPRLIITCFVSVLCTGCLAFFIGLNAVEKKVLLGWIKEKLKGK